MSDATQARVAVASFAVELRDVGKRFGPVVALDGVDLAIRKGEFFSLLGPSGCGKTTTLNLIGGFETASRGTLLIDGQPMGDTPSHARPVNTVFQSYALFPHMSVADNVGFGLRMRKVPRPERRRAVEEMLRLVSLEGFEDRRPSQLSGGQRQRVALARALVNHPAVLLLDEPLGALDLKLRKQMQAELTRLQRRVGITFVYVTHDQDEALSMSDRIAVMDAGRILQVGTPQEVYDEPDSTFVAGFVGVSNLLELEVERVEGTVAQLRLGPRDSVRADVETGVTAGATATVTVRPERIALLTQPPSGDDDRCRAFGTVREGLYAGPVSRFVVELEGGGALMVVRQNTEEALEDVRDLEGREVTLTWARRHTRLLQTKEGSS